MKLSSIGFLLFALFCIGEFFISADGRSEDVEESKDARKRRVEERKKRQDERPLAQSKGKHLEKHEPLVKREPLAKREEKRVEKREEKRDRKLDGKHEERVDGKRKAERETLGQRQKGRRELEDVAADLFSNDDDIDSFDDGIHLRGDEVSSRLLQEIPSSILFPFGNNLESIPTLQTLSTSLNNAVSSLTKIASVDSMTLPNLESAVTSATDLLETLSETLASSDLQEVLDGFGLKDGFGLNALEGFQSAADSLINLINSNNILPGFILEGLVDGQGIVLRNEANGVTTPLSQINPSEIAKSLSGGLNKVLDEVRIMTNNSVE